MAFTIPWAPTQTFQPNPRLVDLIRQSGQDAANAQLRQGEIQGQMWGTLGQTIAGIPGTIAKAQQAASQQKMNDLAVKQATSADQAKTAFQQILKATPQVSVEAGGPYDVPSIVKQMTDAGMDPTESVGHLVAINGAFQTANAGRQALVQKGAAAVAAAGNDPVLALHFVDTLDKNGIYPKEQIQQFRDFLSADPANTAKLTAYLAGPPKFAPAAPGSGVLNETTGQLVPGQQVPEKPNEFDLALKAAGNDPLKAMKLIHPDRAWTEASLAADAADSKSATQAQSKEALTYLRPLVATAGSAEDVVKRAIEIAQASAKARGVELTPEQIQAETLKARRQFAEAGHVTEEPTLQLTPDAIKLLAHQFAVTGQPPPRMGYGKQGSANMSAVINQAAEEYKNLDLPSQVAAYKANQSSLTKLQGTADKVSAFESTAGKNIDQFLALAAKVPDTGVPWLNTPIRTLNATVVGSANQAAFNAARDVALREIARVTNDPNLSGVLSDSARKEVQSLSPDSATFAQIKAVATVLKQDMANVHSSLTEQIGSIQQRIATPPGGAPSGPAPASKPASGTTVPAAVADALKALPSGRRYTVEGFGLYEKGPDGTVRKVE